MHGTVYISRQTYMSVLLLVPESQATFAAPPVSADPGRGGRSERSGSEGTGQLTLRCPETEEGRGGRSRGRPACRLKN